MNRADSLEVATEINRALHVQQTGLVNERSRHLLILVFRLLESDSCKFELFFM